MSLQKMIMHTSGTNYKGIIRVFIIHQSLYYMGNCCVQAFHRQKIQNQAAHQVLKDKISISPSTINDSHFTRVQEMLNQYLSLQYSQIHEWLHKHQNQIDQYLKKLDQYFALLNYQSSSIRLKIKQDQIKIENYFENQSKKQKNNTNLNSTNDNSNVSKNISSQTYKSAILVKLQIQNIQLINKLNKIGLSFFPRMSKMHKEINQFKQQRIIFVQSIKKQPIYYQFIVDRQSYLRFATYPLHAKFTLDIDQVSKFHVVNEKFYFRSQKMAIDVLQNSQHKVSEDLGVIALRIQFFSSQSTNIIKMYCQRLKQQLLLCKRGEMGWQDLNSMKSSFTSHNSSFLGSYRNDYQM